MSKWDAQLADAEAKFEQHKTDCRLCGRWGGGTRDLVFLCAEGSALFMANERAKVDLNVYVAASGRKSARVGGHDEHA